MANLRCHLYFSPFFGVKKRHFFVCFLTKIQVKTTICCGQTLLFLARTTTRHQNYRFYVLRIWERIHRFYCIIMNFSAFRRIIYAYHVCFCISYILSLLGSPAVLICSASPCEHYQIQSIRLFASVSQLPQPISLDILAPIKQTNFFCSYAAFTLSFRSV